jgi:hypothetical protein
MAQAHGARNCVKNVGAGEFVRVLRRRDAAEEENPAILNNNYYMVITVFTRTGRRISRRL